MSPCVIVQNFSPGDGVVVEKFKGEERRPCVRACVRACVRPNLLMDLGRYFFAVCVADRRRRVLLIGVDFQRVSDTRHRGLVDKSAD